MRQANESVEEDAPTTGRPTVVATEESQKTPAKHDKVEGRRRMGQMTRIKGAGRVADSPVTYQQLVPARIDGAARPLADLIPKLLTAGR